MMGGGDDMGGGDTVEVTGQVWLWKAGGEGGQAWHFVTVDGQEEANLRYAALGRTAGFGSIRVSVIVGTSRWQTSLFPLRESGGMVLPLKAEVRKREGIKVGDRETRDGNNAGFMGHPQRVQHVAGAYHGRPVGLAAHDDADGRWFLGGASNRHGWPLPAMRRSICSEISKESVVLTVINLSLAIINTILRSPRWG